LTKPSKSVIVTGLEDLTRSSLEGSV